MTASLISPAPALRSRIEIIDILRGITLLGIVMIHMVEQYYAGIIPQTIQESTTPSLADNIVQGFTGIFIQGKFFMIFSFLFGLSFYIQFANAGKQKLFFLRFTWRLVILFLIGLIHHIHYRGDILTIYAMLGVGLLLCYRLPDKVLLIVSILLILNLPSVLTRVTQGIFFSSESGFPEIDQAVLMHYYQTVKSGTYLDILKLNLAGMKDKMEFQVFSGRIYITFGLFLLGLYAGRKKYFEQLNENLPLVKKLIRLSWKVLGAAIVLAALVFGGGALAGKTFPDFVNFAFGGLLYDAFNACLAMLYVGGILLLYNKPNWHNRLMFFYEAGRMGLTTYVTQTVFGILIFFSIGLGLLGDIGATLCVAIALFIFVVQGVISKLWLRHFHYGPLEWIWRSLTYMRLPALRRKQVNAAPL